MSRRKIKPPKREYYNNPPKPGDLVFPEAVAKAAADPGWCDRMDEAMIAALAKDCANKPRCMAQLVTQTESHPADCDCLHCEAIRTAHYLIGAKKRGKQ